MTLHNPRPGRSGMRPWWTFAKPQAVRRVTFAEPGDYFATVPVFTTHPERCRCNGCA